MTRLAVLAAAGVIVAASSEAAGRAVPLRASDGTSLAAVVYDAPATPAPAVVLVHMLGRTKDEWAELAERLQTAGATVIAVDLRGHGGSSGSAAPSASMALDVRAAASWLSARGEVKALAIVGASFGATAAALAAGDIPNVRGLALISPAADYRGVRLDGGLRKYGTRPLWLLASSEDPYALRTVRALNDPPAATKEQHLSLVKAHGTALLSRDPDSAAALVDWLKRTLVF